MVRLCPSLGTDEQVRTAMADKVARDLLLRRWADLAAGWAREEALKQLEVLAANRVSLTEHEVQQRKGQLWRVLQRISPGKANSLPLVRAQGGSLKSEPTLGRGLLGQAHRRGKDQAMAG